MSAVKGIIVTGASGFIGVHLIEEWLKDDCEVYAVVRPNSVNIARIPSDERVHVIELEMSGYDRLNGVVPSADFFYHLAWEGARVPYRDDVEIQEKNYKCTLNAFEAAKSLGCVFFLGSGSQAEYGITNGIVNEDTPCNPTTEYGKQKLHAYRTLSKLASEAGMKFIWTRIFSLYGPYDYPGTLVMQCVDKMMKNEKVEMTAGTQLWDYLYVEDAARAMKMFAEKDCGSGVYVLASGEYKPLREFVEEIKRVIGSESELKFGIIPYGSGGAVNLTPNPDKTMKAIGWKKHVTFMEGIKNMVERNLSK